MELRDIQSLLKRYLNQEASAEEVRVVEEWYERQLKERGFEWQEGEKERIRTAIEARLLERINENAEGAKTGRLLYIFRPWVAAAIILLLIGTGTLWWIFHRIKPEVAQAYIKIQNDALPGGNRALLTLSNGQTIVLDSVHIGKIASQGNADIIKKDSGILAYSRGEQAATETSYNILSTPRGGEYQLMLPDGTLVWLNAASSIKYPTAFIGKDRTVEVKGEAYFEVKHDVGKPFRVMAGSELIEDLGTAFNVNSYSDEASLNTTLIQGSIQINHAEILKPGEQSQMSKDGRIKITNKVDLEAVMAWKNGRFQFNYAPLPDVLRQLGRWYDVDIQINGDLSSKKVWGKMQRDLNLSEVLDGLRDIGVHFRIEGKKLMVTN
jgi:ferric-dicitrate binding protein FerR (iron transport regulator)